MSFPVPMKSGYYWVYRKETFLEPMIVEVECYPILGQDENLGYTVYVSGDTGGHDADEFVWLSGPLEPPQEAK